MRYLFVLNLMWIFLNIIESSKNETAPEVLLGINEGNENVTCEDILVENRTNLISLGNDGNISSNEYSDACYNNRGYPSLKTCITDCERKDTEYSQCVYNMGIMTHKVLHLKRGEYTIDDDDKIYIAAWNVTKTSEHYRMYDDETLIICLPLFDEFATCREGEIAPARVEFRDNEHKIWILLHHKEFDWNEFFYYQDLLIFCFPSKSLDYVKILEINLVGALISTIALSLALVLSVFIPLLGKNPNLICHMLMLALGFIADCCRIIMKKNKSPAFCITVNALYHFFMLSSFLWMNVHAFDLLLAIKSIKPRKFTVRRFLFYTLISWGIPLILLTVSVIAELREIRNMMPGYKLHCGFEYGSGLPIAYYYGWVALSLFLNIIFFFLTVWTFRIITKEVASVNRNVKKHLFIVTIKLVVTMGLFWICEVLVWAEIGNALVLSWIDILTSFQGVFIVLVYVCRIKLLKKVLTKMKPSPKKKNESFEMKSRSSSNSCSSITTVTTIDRN